MKFSSRSKSFGWFAGLGLSMAAAGCGTAQEENPSVPAAEGAMKFAFGTIPEDVLCVEAQVSNPSRTVLKQQDVFPGSPATLLMAGLPTGEVTFEAHAYPVPCSAVVRDKVLATWTSDPQRAFLAGGVVTPVSLTLRPNGVASVDVDFKPDQPPPPPNELQFDPEYHDFGFVAPGSSAQTKLRLTNQTMNEVYAKVYGVDPSFFVDATDYYRPLPPGGGCTVVASFAPKYGGYFKGGIVADTGSTQAHAFLLGSSVDQPPPGQLVGHWRFDNNMWPYVHDRSNNDNMGVVVRGTDPEASPVVPNLVPGRRSMTALDLANQTWVRVKSSDSINQIGLNQAFTLAAWVNTSAPQPAEGQKETIISRQEAGTAHQHFGLGLLSGMPTAWVHFFFVSAPDTMPRDGSWHHLTSSYDGIDLKIYADGQLQSTSSIGWPLSADTTDVTLGAQQGLEGMTDFFPGALDEARIYDRYLSDGEVAELAKE